MQDFHQIRMEMCDIGRRIYNRQFAAANDGNITVRVGEDQVLCTPTMHCKGFLEPDDIVMIDMTGKQLSGKKPRSSEALLHLEIYRQRNDIQSVVHCHPPHATAFAIAREAIPQCILPEVEVYLGEVPIAGYETPGSQAFAETILPFVHKTDVMILANHGTVSYAKTVEHAYWLTEILDSYCRTLILARQLGHVAYLDEPKARELLVLKEKMGFADQRNTEAFKGCDICANEVFRDTWAKAGVAQRAFARPLTQGVSSGGTSPSLASGTNEERLIKLIADEVVRQLSAKG
jgi:L-fuculose-phosphate aldolase